MIYYFSQFKLSKFKVDKIVISILSDDFKYFIDNLELTEELRNEFSNIKCVTIWRDSDTANLICEKFRSIMKIFPMLKRVIFLIRMLQIN